MPAGEKAPGPPCPDLGLNEECLSVAFATPDPDPVRHPNERVKASTRWCSSNNQDAVNKREGWAVGLWRYANDIYNRGNYPEGDPPMKLLNIDLDTCTLDLAPGTILTGDDT